MIQSRSRVPLETPQEMFLEMCIRDRDNAINAEILELLLESKGAHCTSIRIMSYSPGLTLSLIHI